MHDVIVIGLMGSVGCGKSTLAAELEEAGYHAIAFADHLKQQCADAFAVPRELFDKRELKNTPLYELKLMRCNDFRFIGYLSDIRAIDRTKQGYLLEPNTPRSIMQRFSDFYKAWSGQPDYYVQHVDAMIRKHRWQKVCIPDVRFQAEVSYIRQYPVSCITHINRAYNPHDEKRPDHVSDADLRTSADFCCTVLGRDVSELAKVKAKTIQRIADLMAKHPTDSLF